MVRLAKTSHEGGAEGREGVRGGPHGLSERHGNICYRGKQYTSSGEVTGPRVHSCGGPCKSNDDNAG